jgi:hypothetical protein
MSVLTELGANRRPQSRLSGVRGEAGPERRRQRRCFRQQTRCRRAEAEAECLKTSTRTCIRRRKANWGSFVSSGTAETRHRCVCLRSRMASSFVHNRRSSQGYTIHDLYRSESNFHHSPKVLSPSPLLHPNKSLLHRLVEVFDFFFATSIRSSERQL